jgi:RimJ/RimL family protein N-acetyltransferase
MTPTSARLTLHLIAPAEARRIVSGSPNPSDRWHPAYPLEDELDPLRSLADDSDPDPVFGLYRIQLLASGLAIGGIGFFGPPDEDGSVELGFGLVAPARGHGYATEALQAAVRIAAAHGAQRVKADTAPGNAASQRVLENGGFRQVSRSPGLVYYMRELRR